MNKAELKKVLRPLIKECIKEVIFEEGTLSTIISEVMRGTSQQPVAQKTTTNNRTIQLESDQEAKIRLEKRKADLKENRSKLLDSIGRDSYNGVDIFEGTTPLPPSKSGPNNPSGGRPLDGVDPRDSGVDISAFGSNGIWKKLAGK